MHIDWASMFVLPSRVLLDVEQIMRGFLWCQGLLKKGKANVSWDIVCRKRIEGVLGVRRLDTFNKALMVSHLWNLISSKESEFIWYRIGDGLTASAWFDSWCHVGPISRIVTSRDIFRAGYDLSTKTQDLLRHWDVNTRLVSSCSLCGGQPDSHNHLFFKCGYSTQVWDHMKDLAALSNVVGGYKDVVDFLTSYANRRSCKSVIAKLVFSASVYYIWQERNARLFSNQKRSSIQLTEIITSVIRLKLITCSFKKLRSGLEFARLWMLPESIFSSNTR
ncbi:RNA-directed DNA polymerase, eukaryota, reverse transcriptase zinc-binding domain protein [Tanacetum coccineum]